MWILGEGYVKEMSTTVVNSVITTNSIIHEINGKSTFKQLALKAYLENRYVATPRSDKSVVFSPF